MDGGASTCRSCGCEVSALANWCSACGADLRSSVLVLDGQTDEPVSEVEVESQPIRGRIIGGVLLALAALIGVASFADRAANPADDEVVVEEDAAPSDHADAVEETGDVQEEPPVDVDEVKAQQGGADSEPDADDSEVTTAPVGPLVDEESGLDLLIVTERRTLRVDIDAGVVDELDLQSSPFHSGFGNPRWVVVVGDNLMMLDLNRQPVVQVLPIDDLGAEPRWSTFRSTSAANSTSPRPARQIGPGSSPSTTWTTARASSSSRSTSTPASTSPAARSSPPGSFLRSSPSARPGSLIWTPAR